MLRTAFLLCCYKHTLFSRFPHSIYRRQSSSRRGHTRRLFCCPKNGKEVIREELQEASFAAAPPVFEQVQPELTEEQQTENEKSMLDDLEMFG